MAAQGNEISNLDFANLIGGPLSALVGSQARAAMATIKFVKEVGFDPEGNPVNVSFKFEKAEVDKDGVTSYKPKVLTVPILTILPIPYLRIEEARITFNAKLTSASQSYASDSLKNSASYQAKDWWNTTNFNAQHSYQRTRAGGTQENKTFSIKIDIKVTEQEMPAGMERIIGLLEDAMKSADVGN